MSGKNNRTAESQKEANDRKRVLGSEWEDWDGSVVEDFEDTKKKLFLWVSVFAVFAIVGVVWLFFWLIHPRLIEISSLLAELVEYAVWGFALIAILWLSLFVICSIFNLRMFAPLVLVPKVINFVLNLTLAVGQFAGIPRDRIVNSFLKVHNIVLKLKRKNLNPQELLVLLPRCLRRDNFVKLRKLRERYNFQMFTVGGGQQARLRIKKAMPRAIIAVACERDLLSGFVEVNPRIPVIGLPNRRPEGPCLNTYIDINQIEAAIKSVLYGER
ncbi:MAG: DUF116 domain-containing protein [candidate division Zixibacteria bacterium]|nr:DUF116 domain-containing protein [candidate division Zixibacteria bacterium]